MAARDSLKLFSPAARAWFESAFAAPTEVQERGWRAVAGGGHTLMTAPTGSGKTLAAFFWCLDQLAAAPPPPAAERCRVLYVSPLKALTADVERNLRAPLLGIALRASQLGLALPEVGVAVRTGDTPSKERREMERRPPDILITTPESLFLILTSAARRVLAPVRWVIIDEIHSVAGTKRGAHLALSLERLEAVTVRAPQRIGLSATQRPLDEIGRFLVGTGREVEIIDAGRAKALEIRVEVPVDDMANLNVASTPSPVAGEGRGGGEPPSETPPQRSIWPAIYPRILELILEHRSTIVFVNSRRLSERLAARLNELAGDENLVKSHHGSIAREQRVLIEDALKSGRLRGLVATSSLELGIDMGAVDLVIQVEAPPSVAAGIQRIGRAGHSVGEVSKGTIFPKYRGDLLMCAAVVERMLAAEIEVTVIPTNPLDVLAQQVVAMVALDEWKVEDLAALVRRAHPFRDLGTRTFEAVLDMLAGRYPSEEFSGLHARIVWDRLAGTVRGRRGAQRLAVTSGGTIPDRGLYTVNLLSDGRRVGELDEEMVYETRPGETFVLGASTWRIADITASQVLVTPAPGEPAKIAFWHGDSPYRPVELGRSLGRMTRELGSVTPALADRRLREIGFDDRAVANLLGYLEEQAALAGAVPDDRTIVVERFRDEVGDWRVCILTPFGGHVHAPWSLAIQARLTDRLGVEVQAMHTDDGIGLRLPECDFPPDAEQLFFDPEEITELVTAQLEGAALFASRFRENAARALLLPRRMPGRRTPLWLQRQRGHDLLQVAQRHPDFPILLETYRECLADVFDLPALGELMRAVRAREVRVVSVETPRASPFAASLMFSYVAQYLYEGDSPLAERRAQALTLDRELLAELLGTEELRELLDLGAIAALEVELQGLDTSRWPRDLDEAVDVLRWLGDLSFEELVARGVHAAWLAEMVGQRRTVEVRVGGEVRWVAAEDAGRYRDALGVALPPGLPAAYLEPVSEPLHSLLLRWARTHVPFFAIDPARRWGLAQHAVEGVLDQMGRRGQILSGEFSPGRAGREHCHPEVLRTLRRRTLAQLRREIEAVPAETLGRFLPRWHGIGSSARGPDRLLEVIQQLQGAAIPASVMERDVLSARVGGYHPGLLDELVTGGEVVWVGQGALGAQDGRVALYLRADAGRLVAAPIEVPEGEIHGRLREHLEQRGASFFHELFRSGGGDEKAVLDALWDMVWAGEVTNDSIASLRLLGGRGRRAGHRPRSARLSHPRASGRWSLVLDLVDAGASATARQHAQATTLLQRHGVLTREAVLAEGSPGGFAGLYPVLRAMEESGRVRRGYFIEGLGGSQFALPGAVDQLRASREGGEVVCLAVTDPANPYGTALPWPSHQGRMARVPGALVVLEGGTVRLYLERGGHSLLTSGDVRPEHVAALTAAAGRLARVEIRRVDAQPIDESALAPLLREAGFGSSPRGLVLWSRPGLGGG